MPSMRGRGQYGREGVVVIGTSRGGVAAGGHWGHRAVHDGGGTHRAWYYTMDLVPPYHFVTAASIIAASS